MFVVFLQFAVDLFSLLLRYDTLEGAGFQAAIPGQVFDVLNRDFGANLELFASPLNSRYGRFCSAFPDVDSPFGSIGTAWSFRPISGSFEANPPFADSVIKKMAEHLGELLR